MDMQIVYIDPRQLAPYEGNARKHAPKDIEAIKASVREFGFSDPIGIWGDDNVIVEGHGRQIAAIELGLERVPCIRLDHMSDEQRRAYALAHNKTAELSAWDFGKVEEELAALAIEGFEMDLFGFDGDGYADDAPDAEQTAREAESKYTQETKIPQYTPSDIKPDEVELIDMTKVDELLSGIEKANISDEQKRILRIAAYRHAVIDFDKIGDYYAHSSAEVQRLMEQSALVLIDYNDAIANGYAVLSDAIESIMEADDDGDA